MSETPSDNEPITLHTVRMARNIWIARVAYGLDDMELISRSRISWRRVQAACRGEHTSGTTIAAIAMALRIPTRYLTDYTEAEIYDALHPPPAPPPSRWARLWRKIARKENTT